MYEIHAGAFDVDRLNWYFGGGAHVGFYIGYSRFWPNGGALSIRYIW